MPKEWSVVGDLINFRGLVYSPVNEQGVVCLFSKVAEGLNMYVEEVWRLGGDGSQTGIHNLPRGP